MALKLKVQTSNSVKLKVSGGDSSSFTMHEGVPVYPNQYTGDTSVTPSADTQTLRTAGLMMTEDIVVNPVPSNYGLITWDGSTLTVS